MDVSKILAEIDQKISALQSARSAIVSLNTVGVVKGKRGRPKGSTNTPKPAKKKKRNLSPEGRKAIADAMKRRWENERKVAAKKEAPKKEAPKKEAPKKDVAKKEVAKK